MNDPEESRGGLREIKARGESDIAPIDAARRRLEAERHNRGYGNRDREQLDATFHATEASTRDERYLLLEDAEVEMPLVPAGEPDLDAFLAVPPPGRDATFAELEAYREHTFASGFSVSAREIEHFVETVKEYGPEMVVFSHNVGGFESPGEQLMAQALVAHNPALVERMRFDGARLEDVRDNFAPSFTADIAPGEITRDAARFSANMSRLGAQQPPAADMTFAQFTELRANMRAVGVRLTTDDLATYREALQTRGSAALAAPGGAADLPLSAQMLVDLDRPPAQRELVGADAARWQSVLQQHPQIPTKFFGVSDGIAQARPAVSGPLLPDAKFRAINGQGLVPVDPARNGPQPASPNAGYAVWNAARPGGSRPPENAAPGQPRDGSDGYAVWNDARYGTPGPRPPDAPHIGRSANPYGGVIPANNRERDANAVRIERDGTMMNVPNGYTQLGKIVDINFRDNQVVQKIAADKYAKYPLDVVEKSTPRETLIELGAKEATVNFSFRNGALKATEHTLERGRGLEPHSR